MLSFFQENSICDRPHSRLRVATLLEQGSGPVNEDALLSGVGSTYGVFDGCTSLTSSQLQKGQTGGKIAAEIAAKSFAEQDVSLVEAARIANARILAHEISCGVDSSRKEELWSTSLAVVRLGNGYFDWCQIGDCQIVLVYHDGSHHLLTTDPEHDVETLRGWQQHNDGTKSTIMEAMSEEILHVRKLANINYGVLNGEAQAISFLQSGRETLEGVREILLFSDGLFLPKHDPSAALDISGIVELYHQKGLEGIRDHIRHIQRGDQNCKVYPRFKVHDDIAAIALDFR